VEKVLIITFDVGDVDDEMLIVDMLRTLMVEMLLMICRRRWWR